MSLEVILSKSPEGSKQGRTHGNHKEGCWQVRKVSTSIPGRKDQEGKIWVSSFLGASAASWTPDQDQCLLPKVTCQSHPLPAVAIYKTGLTHDSKTITKVNRMDMLPELPAWAQRQLSLSLSHQVPSAEPQCDSSGIRRQQEGLRAAARIHRPGCE